MGHPRGMIPLMRTWYAGPQLPESDTDYHGRWDFYMGVSLIEILHFRRLSRRALPATFLLAVLISVTVRINTRTHSETQ